MSFLHIDALIKGIVMTNYPERVKEKILPLSVSDDLSIAFKEWQFSDEVYDHEFACETCELCNQEGIRYHFKINNKLTKNSLWIGSNCILKFNIAVCDGDKILSNPNAKVKLNKLTNQMRFTSCLKALENLINLEKNDILKNALQFYKKNEYLTPKYAFVVLWKLNSNKIDYCPSFFRISLKREKLKNDLKEMNISKVHMIWSALKPSQRKLALEYGHSAPLRS
jgi:predicted transposase YbfD/YdcC